jgi:hypothetical protein
MVNIIQFGRGGRGGNKASGVQVHKSYVKVKSIDDKCFYRNFLM